MSIELLDCPMCGCAATFVKHSAGVPGTQGFDKWDAVACKHCRTTVGACDRRFRCREDAAAAWNRRIAAAPKVEPAQQAPDAAELIIRDVCEMEPANPDLNDTICIDVSDLLRIVKRHIGRET